MTRFEYSLAAFCLGALAGPSIDAPIIRGVAAAFSFALAALMYRLSGLTPADRIPTLVAAGLAATAGLLLARPSPPEPQVYLTGAWVRVEGRLDKHFGPGEFQAELTRTRLLEARLLKAPAPERPARNPRGFSPSSRECSGVELRHIGSLTLISPRQILTREGQGRRVIAEGYLRRRRGRTLLRCDQVLRSSSPLLDPRDLAAELRIALARRLTHSLSPRCHDLARALLLGRPPEDRHLRDLARRAGAAHLLVVSGLHLGILALLLRRGLHPLGRITILLGYALLAGGGAPVLRAFAAVTYLWGAVRVGRRPRIGRALLLVAATSLALSPTLARSPAFLLSFGAVAGILAFGLAPWRPDPDAMPTLEEALRDSGGRRLRSWLRSGLLVGVGATLGASPTALAIFGTFSPWAPVVSLILAPFVALLIALSAFTLLVPAAGILMEAPAALFVSALEIASRLPAAQLEASEFGTGSCAALSLYLIAAACILGRGPNLGPRHRGLILVLAAAGPLAFACL